MVCTCGKCLGGYLSPRNVRALSETASASAEMLRDSLPDFPGNLHDPEVYLLNFLPRELRMEVEKKFALGYGNYMDAVAYLLRQGQLPKPRMLRMCSLVVPGTDKECTKSYSEKGHPEYVLDALISVCESTKVKDVPGCEEIPECRNDDGWDFVREVLFAESSFWPCGPYPMEEDNADDGWTYYDTSNWKPAAQ